MIHGFKISSVDWRDSTLRKTEDEEEDGEEDVDEDADEEEVAGEDNHVYNIFIKEMFTL